MTFIRIRCCCRELGETRLRGTYAFADGFTVEPDPGNAGGGKMQSF